MPDVRQHRAGGGPDDPGCRQPGRCGQFLEPGGLPDVGLGRGEERFLDRPAAVRGVQPLDVPLFAPSHGAGGEHRGGTETEGLGDVAGDRRLQHLPDANHVRVGVLETRSSLSEVGRSLATP